MKIVLSGFISAAALASVNADAYQVELGWQHLYETGRINADFEFGGRRDDIDTSGNTLSLDVYFLPVVSSEGPLAEAAFLEKASSVSVAFAKEKMDVTSGSWGTTTYTDTTREAAIRGVLASKFIVEAGFGKQKSKYSDRSYNYSTNSKFERLGLGTYVSDTAELVFSYERWPDVQDRITTLSASYRHLFDLGSETALVFDVDAATRKEAGSYPDEYNEPSTRSNILSFGATYYFSRELGLGGNISLDASPGLYRSTQDIALDYFVAPNVRLSGGVSLERIEVGSGLEIESYGLIFGLASRF